MIQMKLFSPVFPLLSYTPLQYMLRAMEAGTAPAACYADREEDPSVCVIREGHSLFVGGDALSPAADEAMDFLKSKLLMPELRRELHAVKIVFPNSAWKEKLTSAFSDASVHEYFRCVFRHPAPGSVSAVPEPHIQFIKADTLKLENFSMIRDEVESTLGSFDKFLSDGFGYTLVIETKVCGFCTAEYLSERECAIGIEVLQEYQKKGYATQMTACFLHECSKRGLTPYWECWGNNVSSIKTAEHAGFLKLADYPVLLVDFHKALSERQ